MTDQHMTNDQRKATEALRPLRERMLAHVEPARQTEKYVQYEQEIQAMLVRNERRLRLEKWYAGGIWMFGVLFITACLLIVGYRGLVEPAVTTLALAFVILISGGIELVKHFINRSRVEVLKELKGLELHVLALEERLGNQPK
jgi:hypothetical protein